MSDPNDVIRDQLLDTRSEGQPVCIRSGGSKDFIGRTPSGRPLDVAANTGIVNYEPTELVVTTRAGTTLSELESTLGERNQILAFEPPSFAPTATIGGTLACALSGPRRAFAGAARDFTLGVKVMNANGEVLNFGGQVMKNVAGYDVSRLMVGALGTLGVLLEVSLKVLPRANQELTGSFECTPFEALEKMNTLVSSTLPVTGACHFDGKLYVRLSGTHHGVDAARQRLGGVIEDNTVWNDVRELTLPALNTDKPLWRVSVPSTTPLGDLEGLQLIDWGGALRWYATDLPAERLRESIRSSGGHATLFRNGERSGAVFQTPPPGLMALQRRVKNAFDPLGLFNPGRLYAGM